MQQLRIQQSQTAARIILHPAASDYLYGPTSRTRILEIASHSGIRYVRFDEIAFCQAESNYCNVVLVNGEKILLSKTLKWVANQLPESEFVRVHASYLANFGQIDMLGADFVRLRSGEKIPVSRSKKSKMRLRLGINQPGR